MRIYCNDAFTPAPHQMKLPLKIKDREKGGLQVADCDYEMLLPHDWFAALDRWGFIEEVLGLERFDEFWAAQKDGNPKLHRNPLLRVRGYQKIMIPLLLHGDGAEHSLRDSLMILSLRSVLAAKDVASTSLLLAVLPKSCRATGGSDSTHAIWRLVVWSLTAVFHGRHPDKDVSGEAFPEGSPRALVAGKPICPRTGLRGVLWVVAGDMDYMCNELRLPHYNSNSPCGWCKCDAGDIPWSDLRPTAKWRDTRPTADATREAPITRHFLMEVPGVVSQSFHLDMLHVAELGSAAHAIANVFTEITYDQMQQSKPRAIAELNRRVSFYYNQLSIPTDSRVREIGFANLALSGNEYPILKEFKGREVRHLVPVARALSREFQTDDPHTQHRTEMMTHLAKLYDVVDASKTFAWYNEDQSTFTQSVEGFLAHYQWLAKNSTKNKLRRYNVVPKHHYMAHLPDQSRWLSPRHAWTYPGEATVGKVAALAQACLAGTPSHLVFRSVLLKYRVAFQLRLTRILTD